ncbi:MAG: MFS transporter, partial [Thermodesulfobacteriota bacterium]
QGNYDYTAWKYTYLMMAALMLIGVVTTLVIKEPEIKINKVFNRTASDYFGSFIVFVISVSVFAGVFYYTNSFFSGVTDFVSSFAFNGFMAGFVSEALRLSMAIFSGVATAYFFGKTRLVNQEMIKVTYIEPVKDFFDRYGLKLSFILLSLIGLYRISDIVLGVISNLFYQDLGFTKTEIATIVKTYGLFMTIAGGFLGGILAQRLGVLKILFAGAFLSAVTNLLFMILAYSGKDMFMLYVVISADNLAGGLATASFVAFLSSLTNIKFTAVQYAVFSSLMTLIPKLFGGYSGTIVDSLGYESFFLITAVAGIPVLFLVGFAGKYLNIEEKAD